MCVGENNEETIGEIHVQDGSDSFDANECLNGKRCFYLSKTMVTHKVCLQSKFHQDWRSVEGQGVS